jgi:hypothetical protein
VQHQEEVTSGCSSVEEAVSTISGLDELNSQATEEALESPADSFGTRDRKRRPGCPRKGRGDSALPPNILPPIIQRLILTLIR